ERLLPLLRRTLARLGVEKVDHVVISAPNPRVARAARRSLAMVGPEAGLGGVGHLGAADPLVRLGHVLDQAAPGATILVAVLADGCDLAVVRATADLPRRRAPLSTV